MEAPRFDLVDIAKVLQGRKKYILLITLVTMILGTVIYLIAPKKYEATSEFFVANPLYTDRNNIFRSDKAEFINYFGNEDDIDKVMAITKSELVRRRVMNNQDFGSIYKMDTSQKKDLIKLTSIFTNNYKITRTENQSVEISYTDKDPVIAANVANEIVKVVEEVYKNYYDNIRMNIFTSLKNKVNEVDSSIASLTDTMGSLQSLSYVNNPSDPARVTIINSSITQLVKDRAAYLSLMSEFTIGIKLNEMPLLQVITSATPPNKSEGFGLAFTILACAFIGFFFSVFWVLFQAYFRKLVAVER